MILGTRPASVTDQHLSPQNYQPQRHAEFNLADTEMEHQQDPSANNNQENPLEHFHQHKLSDTILEEDPTNQSPVVEAFNVRNAHDFRELQSTSLANQKEGERFLRFNNGIIFLNYDKILITHTLC